jgi:hypothetical protein
VEETIGYEALFSPEGWDATVTGDWSGVPEEDWGPRPGEGGDVKHSVSVVIVDDGYELTCDSCDLYDHLSDATDADNLKRPHEAFLATLVDRWDVDEAIDGSWPEKGSFKVTCPECGEVGSADDPDTAELLTRLHARAETLAAQAKGVRL